MREPDIEGLSRFSKSGDRGLSSFFVGRDAELDWLSERCASVLRDWGAGHDISGRTTVFIGCPGMGKSALLRYFVETRCNRPDDPTSPLAVTMGFYDLLDAGDIAAAFHDATIETTRMSGLLDAIGTDLAKRLKAERTLGALKEPFFRDKTRARTICVLVDEIQNVGPKNEAVLAKLHDATFGLPILPVYAGLNDSVDALRHNGLSRLGRNAQVNLSLLNREAVREAVCDLLHRYRARGAADEKQQWVQSIARDSLGFPQHLQVGLQTGAEALVENRGTATPAGLRTALERAAAARAAYYRDRLSPQVRRHRRALVELVGLMAGSGEPMDEDDLLVRGFQLMREHTAFAKPGREDAARFVGALIHDGVLQENEAGTGYEVPIPSMQTWILGEYAQRMGYDLNVLRRSRSSSLER